MSLDSAPRGRAHPHRSLGAERPALCTPTHWHSDTGTVTLAHEAGHALSRALPEAHEGHFRQQRLPNKDSAPYTDAIQRVHELAMIPMCAMDFA